MCNKHVIVALMVVSYLILFVASIFGLFPWILKAFPQTKFFTSYDIPKYAKEHPLCKDGAQFKAYLRYDCVNGVCYALHPGNCVKDGFEDTTFREGEENDLKKTLPCFQLLTAFPNTSLAVATFRDCYGDINPHDLMLSQEEIFQFRYMLIFVCFCVLLAVAVLIGFVSHRLLGGFSKEKEELGYELANKEIPTIELDGKEEEHMVPLDEEKK
jgi:hypothetical protein